MKCLRGILRNQVRVIENLKGYLKKINQNEWNLAMIHGCGDYDEWCGWWRQWLMMTTKLRWWWGLRWLMMMTHGEND